MSDEWSEDVESEESDDGPEKSMSSVVAEESLKQVEGEDDEENGEE